MGLFRVDFLSPDETPVLEGDEVPNGFPVQLAVLGRVGLIVENVRGLELVLDSVGLDFSLRLGAVEDAPVREDAFESLS